jgi:hypothetical protein
MIVIYNFIFKNLNMFFRNIIHLILLFIVLNIGCHSQKTISAPDLIIFVSQNKFELKYMNSPSNFYNGRSISVLDSLYNLQNELVRNGERIYAFSNGINLYINSREDYGLLLDFLSQLPKTTVHINSLVFSAKSPYTYFSDKRILSDNRPMVLLKNDSAIAIISDDTLFNTRFSSIYSKSLPAPVRNTDKKFRTSNLSRNISSNCFCHTCSALILADKSFSLSILAKIIKSFKSYNLHSFQLEYIENIEKCPRGH